MSERIFKLCETARGFGRVCLDLLWPVRCMVCGMEARSCFCEECRAKIRMPDENVRCPVCGMEIMLPGAAGKVAEPCAECRKSKPAFDKARAATAYADPIRKLIAGFKYGGQTALAPDFAELLDGYVRTAFEGDRIHTLCPVPLFATRMRHRGYNQAEYLARGLARRLGVDCEPELLRRVRPTVSQTTKGARERRANMAGVFQSPPELRHRVYGREIMLVDDVMTTGSTLRECAAALKANGAAKVYAVAVCGGRGDG